MTPEEVAASYDDMESDDIASDDEDEVSEAGARDIASPEG
jgi:hypothetical protein